MQSFIFRNIKQNETDQVNTIEQICFPPNEACSEKSMVERIRAAEELFLVAVDEKTGKIAGFLNGIATDESSFRDEFFTDAGLHDPQGKNIMLLGLDVLPEYQRQGTWQGTGEPVSGERTKKWPSGGLSYLPAAESKNV